MTGDEQTGGALSGIRVLDLGRVLAAPWATQILGDMGAEVIKVERPQGGDMGRLYGPDFLMDAQGRKTRESSFYLCANRNKKSVTVDLSSAEGQQIIKDLAAQCDVFVENFIAGTTERFGLDYASIRAINPRIIYCSVTGYGQDGPYASRPGFDAVFQAHGGMMSVTGIPDGMPGAGPMKTGPSLMDVMTGYNAAVGILAALLHRDRVSGEGQYIDVALLDTAVACQSHLMSNYLISGRVPERRGNEGNGGGPAQVFKCRDGEIYISAGNNHNFVDLCRVLGAPELGHDPRFVDLHDRYLHRSELTGLLSDLVLQWDRRPLMDALVEAHVACSVVNDYADVFDDPQVRHRGILIDMPHPLSPTGSVPGIANPVRLSDTPVRYDRHPPLLGEHNDEVLHDMLGMNGMEIAALRARRVI